jgi:hypothetical protein
VAEDRQDTTFACYDCQPQTGREMRPVLDAAGIATVMEVGKGAIGTVFTVSCDGRQWRISNQAIPGQHWVLWSDDRRQPWRGTHADQDLIRMLGGRW